jgi:deoxyhypusine monooxygenase
VQKLLKNSKDVLLNLNGKTGLPARFRALFTLRGVCEDDMKHAVEIIGQAFTDRSALLKHELAYVLGQMRHPSAIPILTGVLGDFKQDPMVRHEAAEALGAIGRVEAIPVLELYLKDPEQAVRETCEIAIRLLKEEKSSCAGKYARLQDDLDSQGRNVNELSDNHQGQGQELVFGSVDPAPALAGSQSVTELQLQLMNLDLDLFTRYKAMFALRNRGSEEAVLALCTGFTDSSALFRHEIAYVLGQLQHPASVPALAERLRDREEVPMVRHECAEALGSVATEECLAILLPFEMDPTEDAVVRESCVVARDMYEYEHSSDLHMMAVSSV